MRFLVLILVLLAGCSTTTPDAQLINTMSANGCALQSFTRAQGHVSVKCYDE